MQVSHHYRFGSCDQCLVQTEEVEVWTYPIVIGNHAEKFVCSCIFYGLTTVHLGGNGNNACDCSQQLFILLSTIVYMTWLQVKDETSDLALDLYPGPDSAELLTPLHQIPGVWGFTYRHFTTPRRFSSGVSPL